MKHIALTDIGNYRKKNEDSLHSDSHLFIVADGMGGHKAGEVASKKAVEVFRDSFYNNLNKRPEPDIAEIKNTMERSMQDANKAVYKLSVSDAGYAGMGTTLTACYLKENIAHVCHVGDSRLYFKRKKELFLKTHDHTLVGELYRDGKINAEQAFSHPKKNILTQVVGMESNLKPQNLQLELKPEDIILLCTDGLNSMLKDQLIEKIMGKYNSLSDMGHNLIKYAKHNGGYDNITLILIRYE